MIGGGLRVVSAFVHEGRAKEAVHDLKYRGVLGIAGLAASVIGDRIPPLPLVPVPRVLSRRLRYGVDPARELAGAVAAITGAPVRGLLRAPMHAPRRAGGDHRREPVRFRLVTPPPPHLILVDDVVTTGGTLLAAAAAIGPERVVMAVSVTSARKPGV